MKPNKLIHLQSIFSLSKWTKFSFKRTSPYRKRKCEWVTLAHVTYDLDRRLFMAFVRKVCEGSRKVARPSTDLRA